MGNVTIECFDKFSACDNFMRALKIKKGEWGAFIKGVKANEFDV